MCNIVIKFQQRSQQLLANDKLHDSKSQLSLACFFFPRNYPEGEKSISSTVVLSWMPDLGQFVTLQKRNDLLKGVTEAVGVKRGGIC